MSLLIKNVLVGAGTEPQDVLVSGDKISSIGQIASAIEVIDGKKGRLLPGFIDIDSTSDHYLSIITNPNQSDFLTQGITTQIGGHCGSSLAPLLYGTLESIRKWADPSSINVDWHSVLELFAALQTKKLGTNFGMLVGHSTIRRAIIGEDTRDLTENELKVFKRVLAQALKEGALGLSFGLEYAHSRGTPYRELVELAKIVEQERGLCSIHLRSTGVGMAEATEEAINLARDTGVKLLITHFMPLVVAEGEYSRATESIRQARRDGLEVYASVYPFDTSVLPIYRLLPHWAQRGNLEEMHAYISDRQYQDRIASELPRIQSTELKVVGGRNEAQPFIGVTLQEVMEDFDVMDSRRALMRLMQETQLKAVVRFRNINLDMVRTALREPFVFVGSHAPSNAGASTERSKRTFLEFLRLVEEERILPIEDAIKKITRDPASVLGLSSRGALREGAPADLVVIKDSAVQAVLVNGKVVFAVGRPVDSPAAGTCIKRTT